jgi:uncharacterized RDD family membrane protein YckC
MQILSSWAFKSSPIPKNFGRRVLAFLLDNLIIFVIATITSVIFVVAYCALNFPGDPTAAKRIATGESTRDFTRAVVVFYYFSYFTINHWYFETSPGKWTMGLKLRRQDGRPMSFLTALSRSLLYAVSGQLLLGLGFLFPLFRRDEFTLHDLLAGTEVIEAKAAQAETSGQERAA